MAVTDIGLAVNEKLKQGEQWVENVTFIDVTLWGRTAEVAAEYLGKGSSVLIEGRLKLDTWEQDGQKRSKLKVVGERMQMLDGKSSVQPGSQPIRTQPEKQRPQEPARTAAESLGPPADDSDIPF